MIFDTDYWNSLNRKEREDVLLNPQQLGYSLGDIRGGGQIQNLKSGIFMGTGSMELTFFNAPGKGQGKNTPESWGKTERQEMKELARVNEIEVSIHATPNMGGGGASFSGFTGQTFSDEARQKAVDEMARTADFAADVAGGGPIVLHMDGFQRPIFSAGEAESKPGEFKKGQLVKYKEEEAKYPVYFVDDRSGNIAAIEREKKIHRPFRYESGPNKGEIKINKETGLPEMEVKTFNETMQEYKDLPKEKQKEYKNELNYFYHELKEGQVQELNAKAHDYYQRAEMFKKEQKKYEQKLEEYNEHMKNGDDAYKKKFFAELIAEGEKKHGLDSVEELQKVYEDPRSFLKQKINDFKNETSVFENGAIGLFRNAEQAKEEIESFKPIAEYGVQKEANTIARSAMEALKIEEKKKLNKPLWVAPEAYAVEMYGSHPNEYRKIIEESRSEMVGMLKDKYKNKSEEELRKIANEHIRGTFDIGHLNMWKKYFKGDDKEFAKWMEGNVRDLVKDKIIGHVHLSDNFGFHDEHIELGEGNAPLQEFFKLLKEEGFEGKAIAEPGGQREGELHRVWTSALQLGGSPIYRVDTASRTWTDIGDSYFGRTQSPTFHVGDYAPSKDWTLWSETPFE